MKLKSVVTTIVSSAIVFSGAVLADTNVTPAQKNQIEGVVHSYLVQNPEVVVESLQAYQQKQMDQVKKTMEKTQSIAPKFVDALFKNNQNPVAGNPKGTVTLVEFFDYQCPHCVEMDPVINGLITSNDNLRVVFKEFPIRGPISEYAARAALAAQMQGKFMEMHEAIMKNAANLTNDGIIALAKTIGLDSDKLKKDMNSPVVNQQIKDTYSLAQNLGLMGTPALFVAKSDVKQGVAPSMIGFIPGQVGQDQLQQLINQQAKS